MSISGAKFNDLMLDRFMLMNGYLAEFNPDVRRKNAADAQIATEVAKQLGPYLDAVIKESEDFLQLDSLLLSEAIIACTNLRFRNPSKAKEWLVRMLEISKIASV